MTVGSLPVHRCFDSSLTTSLVSLVAVETTGSNCLYQSLSLNDGPFPGSVDSRPAREGTQAEYFEDIDVTVAHVTKLTSKATSLGATSPSAPVVKMALQRSGSIKSLCVPDEMTMQAAALFAGKWGAPLNTNCAVYHCETDDHKILVELACAATLAPAYKPSLFHRLVPPTGTPPTVVLVVCGGFKVSLADLEEYKSRVEAEIAAGGEWEVSLNGESFTVPKA